MSIIRYYLSCFSRSDICEFIDGFEVFEPFKNAGRDLVKLEDCAGIRKDIEMISDSIDKSLKFYFSQNDIDLVKN